MLRKNRIPAAVLAGFLVILVQGQLAPAFANVPDLGLRRQQIDAEEARLAERRDRLVETGVQSEYFQNRVLEASKVLGPEGMRALAEGRERDLPAEQRRVGEALLNQLQGAQSSYQDFQGAYDEFQRRKISYLIDQSLADFQQARADLAKSVTRPKDLSRIDAQAQRVVAEYERYYANLHQYGLGKDSPTRISANRHFYREVRAFNQLSDRLLGAERDPLLVRLRDSVTRFTRLMTAMLRVAPRMGAVITNLVKGAKAPLEHPPIGKKLYEAFDANAEATGIHRELHGLENIPARVPGEKTINLFAVQHCSPDLDQLAVSELLKRPEVKRFGLFAFVPREPEVKAISSRLERNPYFFIVGRGSGKPIEKLRKVLAEGKALDDIVIFPEGGIAAGVFDNRPNRAKFSWGVLRAIEESGYRVNVIPVSLPDNFRINTDQPATYIGPEQTVRVIVHKPITPDAIALARRVGGDEAVNQVIRENYLADLAHGDKHVVGSPKIPELQSMLRAYTGRPDGCSKSFRALTQQQAKATQIPLGERVKAQVVGMADGLKAATIRTVTQDLANSSLTAAQHSEEGPRKFTLDTGRRYGSGMMASVYEVKSLQGLPETAQKLGDGALVAKIPHRLKFGRKGARPFDSGLRGEFVVHDALMSSLKDIEADPGFPAGAAWRRGTVPTLPYHSIETTDGSLAFKPALVGHDLKAIEQKYHPRRTEDLPPEMVQSLREVYDFALATSRHAEAPSPLGQVLPLTLDINPTNMVWVSDPAKLRALGLSKPSFYFYEFGWLPPKFFRAYTKDFDTYLKYFLYFTQAAGA